MEFHPPYYAVIVADPLGCNNVFELDVVGPIVDEGNCMWKKSAIIGITLIVCSLGVRLTQADSGTAFFTRVSQRRSSAERRQIQPKSNYLRYSEEGHHPPKGLWVLGKLRRNIP